VPVWAAQPAPSPIGIYLAQVFERCDEPESPCSPLGLDPASFTGPKLLYRRSGHAGPARICFRLDTKDPIPRTWSRRLSEREVGPVVGFLPGLAACDGPNLRLRCDQSNRASLAAFKARFQGL